MEPQVRDPLALVRVEAKTAAEVAPAARMERHALRLLSEGQTPRAFVEALLRAEKYTDAVRFLAYALPKREAVWWSCLFTLMSNAGHLRVPDARALQAAAGWVCEPTEEHRKQAESVANDETPAGRVARAVAWAGGSLRPPGKPVLPPPPDRPHRGVALAVGLAVRKGTVGDLNLRQRQAVALGMHIARGHYLWTGAASPRHTPTGS